jgi:hypothetical protein
MEIGAIWLGIGMCSHEECNDFPRHRHTKSNHQNRKLTLVYLKDKYGSSSRRRRLASAEVSRC